VHTHNTNKVFCLKKNKHDAHFAFSLSVKFIVKNVKLKHDCNSVNTCHRDPKYFSL